MRAFLLQSLIPIQKSFTVTLSAGCLMALLLSAVESVYWQQKDISVTEISITAPLIALGQNVRQTSGFQANLGMLLLRICRLTTFDNRVVFLNEKCITTIRCWRLFSGANHVFYFRFRCLPRRQVDTGSEVRVCDRCRSLWHRQH